MPITADEIVEIFKQVKAGEFYDIKSAPIENTILKEGDFCICSIFGMSANSNVKKLPEIDEGARFIPSGGYFDAIIHSINDRGWPTKIVLLKHINGETKEITHIPEAPICPVDSWLDIAEMSIDGVKEPKGAFMTIIPDSEASLGRSAAVLVLTRCIRAKTKIIIKEKE